MSHIVNVTKVQITDLDACAAAVAKIGLELVRGQRKYKAHLSHNVDCAHVIRRVDGKGYEVGLVQQPDGSFKMEFDDWAVEGRLLVNAIGEGAEKIAQAYNSEVVMRQLFREGYRCETSMTEAGEQIIMAVR